VLASSGGAQSEEEKCYASKLTLTTLMSELYITILILHL